MMTNDNKTDRLADEILARRERLPLKPDAVTLEGRRVRLLPLDVERDKEALYAATNGSPVALGERSVGAYDADEVVWRYMSAGPFATLEAFTAYLRRLVDTPNALAFCVFDVATGQQVGSASLMNNAPEHLKIEIGAVWYSPVAQRTGANTEATYLMLRRAFELGYRRVEWKCNALNERSRHSALRMGFTFEGIQEYHMIIKGRTRDTAWFRILNREWPDVKRHLEGLLET
ncbi:MAG: GNAT family N-acetyltransferase [Chloroflexi bacterium]|nr:GNAT family N-acetyltransferase [Chloroflexota bacterium]